MISQDIDLTEYRDFGRDSSIGSLDIPIELWDEEIMTSEDYDKILRWESIFGKRRHDTEKYRLFGRNALMRCLNDRAYSDREYRIPWLPNTRIEGYKFPWHVGTVRIVRINDRGQGDLFDLR